MLTKPEICGQCPITHATGTGFVPPQSGEIDILLVGPQPDEYDLEEGKPFSGGKGTFLTNLMKAAKLPKEKCGATNLTCCRASDGLHPSDVKWHHTSKQAARVGLAYCRENHLDPLLRSKQWKTIYALGDEALEGLTNRRGILVWRGSPLPLRGNNNSCRVLPTLHPSKLFIDFKYTSTVIGDFKKSITPPPEHYELFSGPSDLANFRSKSFAFDFEWDHNGNISICGLSEKLYSASVGSWSGDNLVEYRRIFEEATDLIGHNIIGADLTHIAKLDWCLRQDVKLHDTMLKQHLCQPDYKHDLGFVASVFTNKVFWKGRGKEEEDEQGNIIGAKAQWKTWNQADAIPRLLGGYGGCNSADEAYRLYNARDTDASFQINESLDRLLSYYNLEGVYWNVSLPVAFICREIADRGIRIDPAKVKVIRKELGEEIEQLEYTLPEGLRTYNKAITIQIKAPPGTYKERSKICKGSRKLPHDPITFTFSTPGLELQCSSCGKTINAGKLTELKKIKVASSKLIKPWNSSPQVKKYAKSLGLKARVNRKTGNESADVKARKIWGRTHPEFQIVDKLKDLGTERNNFAKQEMEDQPRLYFNLLVHGTSEGRFSSSGQRDGIDPNIQNQPKSIRKIYIPEPGNCFIELDYASGENMLTAWLAQDHERLQRLRSPGYSEHLELAKRLFGLPSEITKEEASTYGTDKKDLYGIGKVINHGSNYGMTYIKLREELETNGFFYTEKDCKEFIKVGEGLNPGTTIWKKATIELARRDGFLRNPFGRMRWFSTRDIATKSLAFLPASTLADIIIRAMIGHYPERFPQECTNLGLQVTGSIEPNWIMAIQIHDSLVLQGPPEGKDAQLSKTKAIMTQSWAELGGFNLEIEAKQGLADGDWGSLKKVKI